jgi:hypothetical protein
VLHRTSGAANRSSISVSVPTTATAPLKYGSSAASTFFWKLRSSDDAESSSISAIGGVGMVARNSTKLTIARTAIAGDARLSRSENGTSSRADSRISAWAGNDRCSDCASITASAIHGSALDTSDGSVRSAVAGEASWVRGSTGFGAGRTGGAGGSDSDLRVGTTVGESRSSAEIPALGRVASADGGGPASRTNGAGVAKIELAASDSTRSDGSGVDGNATEGDAGATEVGRGPNVRCTPTGVGFRGLACPTGTPALGGAPSGVPPRVD